MNIRAYGKFFSWEDTLFYPGWEDEGGEYARILAHQISPPSRYRAPSTKPEKDFSNSSGIYLLHDERDTVVYVGQAKSLLRRINAHTGDHLNGRWNRYSWYALDDGASPETAPKNSKHASDSEEKKPTQSAISLDVVEAILRTSLEPKLNLQSGRWGEVVMYNQSHEYDFFLSRENYYELIKLKSLVKKLRKKIPT